MLNVKIVDKINESDFDIEIILVNHFSFLDTKTKKLFKDLNIKIARNSHVLLNSEKKLYMCTSKLKKEDLKIACSNAIRIVQKTNLKNIKFSLVQNNKEFNLKDIMEGFLLGAYSFDKYKSNKSNHTLNLFVHTKGSNKNDALLNKEFEESKVICENVNMVRDMVNTPPEDFYPQSMADKAEEIALNNNLTCQVYSEEYLKNNNMNAMLSVGRASRHESKLIHLTYKPKNPKKKIVIVGKGLTYDSGGLSLKGADSMVSMKCDKSGGCAVLGIMNALNKLNYPCEVHGIIGAVENMIGGDAYKPDDILYAKNNVSIEVKNTDAEGRLVLCDCLCYSQDSIKDIDYIIDIATLTGASIIALGGYSTAIMGHSKKLKDKLIKAGDKSGELLAYLPYNRYLNDSLDNEIADISNTSKSKAGSAITASLFLDKFIKKSNKKKWMHLDIAGPAYKEKNWGYNSYGGSGASVRLLLKFIEKLT